MSPIIVHQYKEYSEDLHFNIPLDWTAHHKPPGYMDRDGWLKSMTQFSNVCGASPVNNRILFFDGHDSHFDDCTQRQMKCKNTQPFVLKSGKYGNYQTNDNGTNAKLKSLYNGSKSFCMLKYGMKNILPHHMKSILVKSWDSFNVYSVNIVREIFLKKIYSLSFLPNFPPTPRHVLPPSKSLLGPILKISM